MPQSDLFDMEWYMEDEKNEIEIDAPFLLQETERELKAHLFEELPEGDSTDGSFQLIENLTNKIQEDFDEIIGDSIKKSIIKSLAKPFATLLNTKVDGIEKLKKNDKNCHQHDVKTMVKTKLTVKRWSGPRPRTSRTPPWLMSKRQKAKVKRPFKIKQNYLNKRL